MSTDFYRLIFHKTPSGQKYGLHGFDLKTSNWKINCSFKLIALIKIFFFNFGSVGYSNKKQVEDTFKFVWANSENSNDVILRKKTIASILNLVRFYLKICNFDPFQSEICTLNVFAWTIMKLIILKLISQNFFVSTFIFTFKLSKISHVIEYCE